MRIRTLLTVTFLLAVAPRASEAAIIFTSHQASTTAFARAKGPSTPSESITNSDSSATLADLNTSASASVFRAQFDPNIGVRGSNARASGSTFLEPVAAGSGFGSTTAGPPDSRGRISATTNGSGADVAAASDVSSLSATLVPGASFLDYSVQFVTDRPLSSSQTSAAFRLVDVATGSTLLELSPTALGTQTFNGTLAVAPSAALRVEASSSAMFDQFVVGGGFGPDTTANVDFAVTASVPEPAAAGLLGAAGLLALLRRRRF